MYEKPIVFLTSGTRGDVQPITALARGLQDKGYAVRVAAPPAFRELVESQSVPYAPLEGNPSDLMTVPGSQSALTFNNTPLQGINSALGYLKAAQPIYAQMLQNAWQASQDASALVIGLPTIWGTSIAEKLGVRCIGAFLQPVTATNEFPSPLLPTTLKLGRTYNKLSYWLISQAIYLPWRKTINQWRHQFLELSPLRLFHNHFEKMDTLIFGFSEKVVTRPKDWSHKNFITGYWSLPVNSYSPPSELISFITNHEKPFFFGFGSPGMYEPGALIDLLFTAIKKSNIRAIISLPKDAQFQKVQQQAVGLQVYLLSENIPHNWLFPQMSGIVHHGGAGTTAEALKAGVPSFVTPLAVDQFFWGERVSRLEVGPRAVPQRELTVKKLINALNEMKGERMKEAAKILGKELRAENGIAEAIRILETILETGAG